ncbi:NAD(P)/FAD-dependent oxidoreductase [uncultured Nocardioides sp.]|uniref:NAD(P)/FAD-dependent oxidoreductase n=1 Tax=uncultured Nocardioides sp. TaxID=198441 RepID=UPI00261A0901|nr:FAD-dependent oxidoreductase [uncultured Nocardioides sp.]
MSPRHVVVVGASLAGHATARALRDAGYDGALTIVGDEQHRPYDRPPLSKGFLDGTLAAEDLALEDADDTDLAATWLVGHRAVGLDVGLGAPGVAATHCVTLDDGTVLVADAVVLATGARARRLPAHLGGDLAGVHTLRTLDDALALRAELVPGSRLVLVGAGFVGAEIAATASKLGVDVSLVEASTTPLAGPLGAEVGAAVAGLHAAHGTPLYCGVPVAGLTGATQVDGVLLDDGTHLPADVVVAGIGSVPATDWLVGTGVPLTDAGAVAADADGATAVPGVWAVGDCSAWWDGDRAAHHRTEHWNDALVRPRTVAASLLGLAPVVTTAAPYFWSDQYGVRLQFAGRRTGDEVLTVEAGSLEGGDALAVYWRGHVPVAVLGMGQPKLFNRWKRSLGVASVAA